MKKLLLIFCAALAAACSSPRPAILENFIFDGDTFDKQYELNKEAWDAAFAFIEDPSIDTMEAGPWHQLTPSVRGRVQQTVTRAVDSASYEVHRKVIDVFYVLEGEDIVGVSDLESMGEVKKPYKEKSDVELFYSSTAPLYSTLTRGQGIILFPGQAHSPNLTTAEPAPLKLVVVKIPWVE